jgi:hypothetical protein
VRVSASTPQSVKQESTTLGNSELKNLYPHANVDALFSLSDEELSRCLSAARTIYGELMVPPAGRNRIERVHAILVGRVAYGIDARERQAKADAARKLAVKAEVAS